MVKTGGKGRINGGVHVKNVGGNYYECKQVNMCIWLTSNKCWSGAVFAHDIRKSHLKIQRNCNVSELTFVCAYAQADCHFG